MDSDTIQRILAVDIPADKKLEILAILASNAPARSKQAIRQERYMLRKKNAGEIRDPADGSADVSADVSKLTPPSPPPLSPTPPIPAPTPASDRRGAYACEGREGQETKTPEPDSRQPETKAPDSEPPPPPAKPSKPPARRQAVEADIAAANAQLPPLDLRSEGFPEAWAEWQEHRTALYRREPRKRWSAQAARNTLHECARHGAAVAVMAIRAAIANGWQGLVWDRLKPNHPRHHGNDSRAGRPPVSRNVSPLPAGLPSLNDTAVNAPGRSVAGLEGFGRPDPSGNGKSCW